MSSLKCTAIVLRFADYKDADRMVTLFSRQQGRISASVRGVKKQNSKLRAGAELFSLGEYIINISGTRHSVTGYTQSEAFYPLRADVERLWCAMLACLLTESVITDQPEPELFDVLTGTLYALAYSDEPAKALMTAFMQDFLLLQGIYPSTGSCALCGGTPAAFSASEGGVVCEKCISQDAIKLSMEAVYILRDTGGTVAERAGRHKKADDAALFSVFSVLMAQARYRLDRGFCTADFLFDMWR